MDSHITAYGFTSAHSRVHVGPSRYSSRRNSETRPSSEREFENDFQMLNGRVSHPFQNCYDGHPSAQLPGMQLLVR